MDWRSLKAVGLDAIRKYKHVLLVILAGVILMALPTGTPEESAAPQAEPQTQDLEGELSDLLSLIQGAGKVRVLLTERNGAETWYQSDVDTSASGDKKQDTVLYTDGSRAEAGLVRRIDPPVYQGAVVLCQGADSAAVRLAIVEAVANATGLTTDQISVLKMK